MLYFGYPSEMEAIEFYREQTSINPKMMHTLHHASKRKLGSTTTSGRQCSSSFEKNIEVTGSLSNAEYEARRGIGKPPPNSGQKRQKIEERVAKSENVFDSIEVDDDEPPSALLFIAETAVDKLKAKCKTLQKQDEQLAAASSALDVGAMDQKKDIEQLKKQQKACGRISMLVKQALAAYDVRKLENKKGQIAAQCSGLEDENKILRSQLVSLMD
ncbi:hypothetical protein C7999DRAFT_29864 [Corynascus novoguineensis]|uniref:Uncharacterized protein n=1 Tax=Corynascus novoguineensis TaxID=1126955 RepID=A0AAN7HH31_9PEZI|nr:hypothetical protein C7999DRAFT_29864 [Corynascus novoguineensis]